MAPAADDEEHRRPAKGRSQKPVPTKPREVERTTKTQREETADSDAEKKQRGIDDFLPQASGDLNVQEVESGDSANRKWSRALDLALLLATACRRESGI